MPQQLLQGGPQAHVVKQRRLVPDSKQPPFTEMGFWATGSPPSQLPSSCL